jgi:DNA modification methylase
MMRPDGCTIDQATEADRAREAVSPTQLMRYLCRLVTPPSGAILDPFMGSGSTGKAAVKDGFGAAEAESRVAPAGARCGIG